MGYKFQNLQETLETINGTLTESPENITIHWNPSYFLLLVAIPLRVFQFTTRKGTGQYIRILDFLKIVRVCSILGYFL